MARVADAETLTLSELVRSISPIESIPTAGRDRWIARSRDKRQRLRTREHAALPLTAGLLPKTHGRGIRDPGISLRRGIDAPDVTTAAASEGDPDEDCEQCAHGCYFSNSRGRPSSLIRSRACCA